MADGARVQWLPEWKWVVLVALPTECKPANAPVGEKNIWQTKPNEETISLRWAGTVCADNNCRLECSLRFDVPWNSQQLRKSSRPVVHLDTVIEQTVYYCARIWSWRKSQSDAPVKMGVLLINVVKCEKLIQIDQDYLRKNRILVTALRCDLKNH